MEPTNDHDAQIRQLLELSEDALLSLLPAYDPRYEHTMFAPKGQLEAGRRIFAELRETLFLKVCVEWQYCEKKASDKLEDPVILVASIADAVAEAATGIPPFVISTLMVKIGLSGFCRCP